MKRIAEICREHGILLIADEIMTGMGRTGQSFAVQHWSVEPDLILVGKGVASGYAPLGAVLISSRVVEAFAPGSGAFQHGFTLRLLQNICANYSRPSLYFLTSAKSVDSVCSWALNL